MVKSMVKFMLTGVFRFYQSFFFSGKSFYEMGPWTKINADHLVKSINAKTSIHFFLQFEIFVINFFIIT